MDRFLDYALWLTINELAEPWLAALRDGSWSPTGRDPQLTFALTSIEPALAGPALTDALNARGLPADGSGPWIELIGRVGDPVAAARLLDVVAAHQRRTPCACADSSRWQRPQASAGSRRLQARKPSPPCCKAATVACD
jgi:hypothetical protein